MSIADDCPARIELDIRQQLWLESLPMPAHTVGRTLPCSLDARHAGPHASLGQQSGDTDWWVQWTLTAAEINPLPPCSKTRTPSGDEDDDPCLLYAQHPGRHLYGDERG
ncbi:hypothetical protein AB0M20_16055 [Actinoplanes sp. NPDC051633]|uniref:hypothetical protein n=1 Tax=Actinoplanes sp. NPDC051633 TaxID=3155670 RepID=UPI00343282F1